MPDEVVARPYAPSALPSVTARVLAFLAIVVGGLCGGVIGFAITDLQCGPDERLVVEDRSSASSTTTTAPATEDGDEDDGCGAARGIGAVVGAVLGAAGVAVVAVLVLRAMAEWRRDLADPDP